MLTWLAWPWRFACEVYALLTCKHEEWEQVVPTPPPHALRCKRCGCALRCGCWECRVQREPHRDW